MFLDGAELLQEAAEDWLGHLLDGLGEGHRVFLASWSEPRLRFAQRVAAGTAEVIGAGHLAFTRDETARCLGPRDDDSVHRRLDGWPIGVNLAALGISPVLGAEHILDEALSRLPLPLRRRLPDASVLDLWTEDTATDLGVDLPAGWLRDVRRAGLPLIPLDGAYRPHHLLRERLDRDLRQDPGVYAALHVRAGRRAETRDDSWQALEHYRQARAERDLLRVAGGLAPHHERRGEYRLVRQVLEPLGAALPVPLRTALGLALYETGDPVRGEATLRGLYAQGERDPGLLFALGILCARTGRPGEQLALVEEGLRGPHSPRDAARLTRLWASAQLALGRADDAVSTARTALKQARTLDDPIEIGAVLDVLQVACRETGDLAGGEAALRWALSLYQQVGMPARALIASNDLAMLLWTLGRPQEAAQTVDEALAVAEQEHSAVQALLLETRADLAFDQRDMAAAASDYQAALRSCEHYGVATLQSRILPRLTDALLHAGDPAAAVQAVMHARLSFGDTEHARSALVFSDGLLAGDRGDWPAASLAFSAVTVSGFGAPESVYRRAVLRRAQADLRAGTFSAARVQSTEEQLRHAGPLDFTVTDEAAVAEVRAALSQFGHAVSPWADALPRTSDTPVPSDRPSPVMLHLKTLGPLNVTVDGQRVHIPLSRSAEVLVWLAWHGGTATRGEIMNDLWDGSTEQRHIEYFKVAVRHLRTALTSHPAITFNPVPFEAGRYRLAEQLQVHLDARLPAQALRERTCAALQAALDAYGGPFLNDSSVEWACVRRTELLEQSLSAGLTLAATLEDEDSVVAAATYERCLELDPLSEETHIRLIRLWSRLDEPEGLRRSYTRYQRMVHDEYGQTPDPAIRALAE
ncbi:hypothetical protein DAAJ005_00005 (plasmid) [Deinococcus sp. AJ005]|nr:hypothetical protein DAAJ005_00005 [Deinococcus sp. AJ005]